MATANPIPDDTTTAEHPAANLLVLATSMAPEQFQGLLANLGDAFSAESVIVATQSDLAAVAHSPLRVVPTAPSSAAWTLKPGDFINAFETAQQNEVRAVLML